MQRSGMRPGTQRKKAVAKRLKDSFAEASAGRDQVPDGDSAFSAGLTVAVAPLRISSTASARSFVPSGLKRNTPSAPEKPDGFVSTGSAKRWEPCVRTRAAASDTAS